MIRGLFFVVGFFIVMQGAVCLGVESMTISKLAAPKLASFVGDDRLFTLPIWFGPLLVFAGAITLLYAVALPTKRHR